MILGPLGPRVPRNSYGLSADDYNAAKPPRGGYYERDRFVLPVLLALVISVLATWVALGIAGALP